MPRISLLAKLPTGDRDGLSEYADRIIGDRKVRRLAVCVLGTRSVTDDEETDDKSAVLRIVRIEMVTDPADCNTLQQILMRAIEQRTGRTSLFPAEPRGNGWEEQ